MKCRMVLRKCPLPCSPSCSSHCPPFCLPAVSPHPAFLDFCCAHYLYAHPCHPGIAGALLCGRLTPVSCVPCPPHLHCVCVMSPVCRVVVPSVSEESPCASESGVLLSQDPSAKPVLLLPPKKPAAFSGDHEETPVKQLSLLKQPPALPPKPTARIANHLTGESSRLLGAAALPLLQGISSLALFSFSLSPDEPLASLPFGMFGISVCVWVRTVVTWVCVFVSRSDQYPPASPRPRAFSCVHLTMHMGI